MRTRRISSSSDPVSRAETEAGHQSVLLHEVVEQLRISPTDVVIDATLGGAGHARAIALLLDRRGVLIGFDLDSDAIGRAQRALADTPPRRHLVEANFRSMADECTKLGITRVDKVLFDLGWSGYQLGAGRGFSFRSDEPLVMTYATSGDNRLTAHEMVNSWSESSLADIIFGWGQERYARRIARSIVEHRERAPIKTARELSEIIRLAVPARYAHGRIHPATKTFQALRIAVNDELGALKDGLAAAWQLLAPAGRIAVISFHSIEDALVKRQFLAWEQEGAGVRITRKPITGSKDEIVSNPRARSAKLRVIEKKDQPI